MYNGSIAFWVITSFWCESDIFDLIDLLHVEGNIIFFVSPDCPDNCMHCKNAADDKCIACDAGYGLTEQMTCGGLTFHVFHYV